MTVTATMTTCYICVVGGVSITKTLVKCYRSTGVYQFTSMLVVQRQWEYGRH